MEDREGSTTSSDHINSCHAINSNGKCRLSAESTKYDVDDNGDVVNADCTLLDRGREDTASNSDEVSCTIVRATKTTATYIVLFSTGMVNAIVGATLLHLEIQTQSSTDRIATIFFFRSIGQLSGNLLTILSYKLNKWRIELTLIFGCLLMVAMNSSIPWCTSFPVLAVVFIFHGCSQGMAGGGGCGPLLIKTWKLKAGPFLQALFFVHSTGAMVTPMIVDLMLQDVSHLLHLPSDKAYNMSEKSGMKGDSSKEETNKADQYGSSSLLNTSSVRIQGLPHTHQLVNTSKSDHAIEDSTFDAYFESSASPILLPYLMPAIGLILAVAIYIVVVLFDTEEKETKSQSPANKHNSQDTFQQSNIPIFLVAILMCFTLLMGALECTYGGWIVAFVIRYLNDSYTNATRASTCFWGANALGRGVSVITTKLFKPKYILGVHLLLLTISVTVLIAACDKHIAVTWACSLLYGFSLAPILGVLMMYCQNFVPLPEWLISLIHCTLYVGFMVVPALVGFLFARYTPLFLLYGLLFCIVIMLILFTILCIYERNVLSKHTFKLEEAVVIEKSENKHLNALEKAKEIDIYRSQSSLC